MKNVTNEYAEFFSRAGLFGHDADALIKGEEIITYHELPSAEEGRRLLSNATPEIRSERQKLFFNPVLVARQRLGQGKHDRGEAMVFADAEIEEHDVQGLNNHLPLHVKSVSVLRKVVPAGQTWDVSVRGVTWGLDDLEELYTTVNIGELILEPGARIVVRGNVFSLLCQRIVHRTQQGVDSEYQIGVLPTPFSVDLRNGSHDGGNGENGSNGNNGRDGVVLRTENSFLGLVLQESVQPADMKGEDGENGCNGYDGIHGRNGGMCKLAELTFRKIEGHIVMFSQAGQGGDGGNGGNAGNGGNGGNGSQGAQLMTGALNGGDGGNAGVGGNGGRGGNGGHGGLASNIYITVDPANEHQLSAAAFDSQPGAAGYGGNEGKAGLVGHGGIGPKDGKQGQETPNGEAGKNGFNGRSRSAAWIYINEKPMNNSQLNSAIAS